MDFKAKYTNGKDPDFARLSEELEQEFYEMYGAEHDKYAPYNGLEHIHNAILLYDGDRPFACASFKEYDSKKAELKRVYVHKEYRGKGYSTYIVSKMLERAKEKGYATMILETGLKQEAAIALYKKLGFSLIPNYGQYIGCDNSICMSLTLQE